MKRVDNGPVTGLPSSLVCGECGAKSGDVLWQAAAQGDDILGMVGFANCSRCGVTISGILANDPERMEQLRMMVELTVMGEGPTLDS